MNTDTSNKDRVQDATPSSINEEIEKDMWLRIEGYMHKSDEEISLKIEELNKEWDIERYLGVNMSSLALAGLATAALTKNKAWNILPAVVLSFFFQHSVQGWCPPLPILRKMKIRTRKEIEQEKYALKTIRGDFNGIPADVKQDISRLKEAILKN